MARDDPGAGTVGCGVFADSAVAMTWPSIFRDMESSLILVDMG